MLSWSVTAVFVLKGRSGGLCAICEDTSGKGVCSHLSHHAPALTESQQCAAGGPTMRRSPTLTTADTTVNVMPTQVVEGQMPVFSWSVKPCISLFQWWIMTIHVNIVDFNLYRTSVEAEVLNTHTQYDMNTQLYSDGPFPLVGRRLFHQRFPWFPLQHLPGQSQLTLCLHTQ